MNDHDAPETPIIDVTQPGALPPPPYTEHPAPPGDDAWLAALTEAEDRVSVYADSHGRVVRLTHPGLIPPAAITLHDGVPAGPVEFLHKEDDV